MTPERPLCICEAVFTGLQSEQVRVLDQAGNRKGRHWRSQAVSAPYLNSGSQIQQIFRTKPVPVKRAGFMVGTELPPTRFQLMPDLSTIDETQEHAYRRKSTPKRACWTATQIRAPILRSIISLSSTSADCIRIR